MGSNGRKRVEKNWAVDAEEIDSAICWHVSLDERGNKTGMDHIPTSVIEQVACADAPSCGGDDASDACAL